jgi:hypothetical protein
MTTFLSIDLEAGAWRSQAFGTASPCLLTFKEEYSRANLKPG